MGSKVSRTDFEWVYTDEPHATRRKEILKKYPEIKNLMGYDPNFKFVVSAMVLVQCISFWILKDASFTTLLLAAYCFGGVINHSLGLAVHEISHNLAFGHSRPMYNRLFGMFANLPIGIPMSISFKKYHLEHHRYQGDEKLDTDLPTEIEAKLFCSTFTKLLWVLLQPFFYTLRAFFVYPKPPSLLELINAVVQIVFDAVVCYFCGVRILLYMIGGTLLAMGLHPVAGHFISEHYMFKKGFETYSYYGPLNFITFNVGYHTEHHDFPSVPGSRLPLVKNIAKEYYEDLPQHNSWTRVIWDFITDPSIGPYARVKRQHKPRD
jgi:sphingolipid delta-4 desaturase